MFPAIAKGLAGAGRGYEAAQGRPIAGPTPGQQGPLMDYLGRRKARQDINGAAQDNQPTQGLPPGAMPPPLSPMAAPPVPYPQQPPQPPQAPQPMAQGQVVTKPTTALLGEDGPEAVVPLNGRTDARVSPGMMRMNYRGR